jgi:dihydrofolate synthase / folylpolyglutamate synthase
MIDIYESIHTIYKSYMRAKPHIHGLDGETRSPDLMQRFFHILNISTSNYPAIAVTGSKGKGSTALLCSALLEAQGLSVGLVTSPHMINFCERIRVNGKTIPDESFRRLTAEIEPFAVEFDQTLPDHKFLGPTGLILAVALRYFEEKKVDIIVLEAGRGGRYDDTVIYSHAVTCITPVMEEHLDKLGPSVSDVAWNKAGLIQADSTVISANQSKNVEAVLRQEAERVNADLFFIGQQINFQSRNDSKGNQEIIVSWPERGLEVTHHLVSPASYQAHNLAIAIGAVEALKSHSAIIERHNAGTVRDLRHLRLAGRCERIATSPQVLIDGAINRQSSEEFLRSAAESASRPTVLVTAMPEDKDAKGLLETLVPLVDRTIVTVVDNPVLTFDNQPQYMAKAIRPDTMDIPDTAEAFRQAILLAGAGGTIWIVGTQSLLRKALIYWDQNLDNLWLQA